MQQKLPSKSQLLQWIPNARDIFKFIMPPIKVPYPETYIADGRNYRSMRRRLGMELGVYDNKEECVMEYLHGEKGCAILICKHFLTNDNEDKFCLLYWHELGHFYAINSEPPGMYRYNDPYLLMQNEADLTKTGSADDNRSMSPTMGVSDDRLKQEGYRFWQEFIAEAISKYVSYIHRSKTRYYHPELIEWNPEIWEPIVEQLKNWLKQALDSYWTAIDEYALAHYFATLLMDDFVVLYVKAAADRKLKVNSNGKIVLLDHKIEPTCISDMDEIYRVPLWALKKLLEKQLKKKRFWKIDENFLLKIGKCMDALRLAQILFMTEHFDD